MAKYQLDLAKMIGPVGACELSIGKVLGVLVVVALLVGGGIGGCILLQNNQKTVVEVTLIAVAPGTPLVLVPTAVADVATAAPTALAQPSTTTTVKAPDLQAMNIKELRGKLCYLLL